MQRNQLARLVFAEVEVEDDRVATVVPRPDFAPFFAAMAPPDDDPEKSSDPDPDGSGSGFEAGVSTRAPSRSDGAEVTGVGLVGSVWDLLLPPGALLIGSMHVADRRYAAPRARKLSPQCEALIQTAASRGATLRQLAAEHGVSHVTVARIVRDAATGTQTVSRL